MIEIIRFKYGLRIREIYFSNEKLIKKKSIDMDVYIQSKVHLQKSEIFNTLFIDLTQDEDQIFKKFTSGCKYDIRRAANKDGLLYNYNLSPTLEELSIFINFYNEFALFRKVPPANQEKLNILLANKYIHITSASLCEAPNVHLVMHCYICDSVRSRLYLSATAPRLNIGKEDNQIIGRANKFLHWEDLKAAKRNGILLYDFGGISTGGHLKGIDDFKRQFGGIVQDEYNAKLSTSPKGLILLGLYSIINYLKKMLS